MKRFTVAILTILTIIVLAGCSAAYQGGGEPRAGADPKLGRSTWYEEGRIVFLAVDTRAASAVKKGQIFPLALMLVNKTDTALRLNSEEFTLVDSGGSRYPLLPYETYRSDYRRLTVDRKLSEPFHELTNQHLGIDGSFVAPYRPQPLLFYAQGGPRSDSLELGPKRYTRGFLYFTIPEGGLKEQSFELHVASKDLQDPVYVRFFVE